MQNSQFQQSLGLQAEQQAAYFDALNRGIL
jgi:hypothetical protein